MPVAGQDAPTRVEADRLYVAISGAFLEVMTGKGYGFVPSYAGDQELLSAAFSEIAGSQNTTMDFNGTESAEEMIVLAIRPMGGSVQVSASWLDVKLHIQRSAQLLVDRSTAPDSSREIGGRIAKALLPFDWVLIPEGMAFSLLPGLGQTVKGDFKRAWPMMGLGVAGGIVGGAFLSIANGDSTDARRATNDTLRNYYNGLNGRDSTIAAAGLVCLAAAYAWSLVDFTIHY